MLRPATRRFFERAAPGWDERVKPDRPEHLEALAAALEHLDRPPERILDLGTGSGAAALMLARRFRQARVLGVDISEAMVELARAKLDPELAGRLEFAVADAAALDCEDGAFDLVAQVSVPVFFDEIARVLRAGGYAVVVSSLGKSTPFHTPGRMLERGFGARGLETVAAGGSGAGTFHVARLAPRRR